MNKKRYFLHYLSFGKEVERRSEWSLLVIHIKKKLINTPNKYNKPTK